MGVLIDNRQKKFKIPLKTVRAKALDILDALGCHDRELSIVITDDPGIRELNRLYLQRDRPTNVIAFPMQEGEFSGISPHLMGDVVLSAETAAREAREAGIGFSERVDQLIIHGILHLAGYDHESDAQRAEEMAAKSEELSARLKLMAPAAQDS